MVKNIQLVKHLSNMCTICRQFLSCQQCLIAGQHLFSYPLVPLVLVSGLFPVPSRPPNQNRERSRKIEKDPEMGGILKFFDRIARLVIAFKKKRKRRTQSLGLDQVPMRSKPAHFGSWSGTCTGSYITSMRSMKSTTSI